MILSRFATLFVERFLSSLFPGEKSLPTHPHTGSQLIFTPPRIHGVRPRGAPKRRLLSVGRRKGALPGGRRP